MNTEFEKHAREQFDGLEVPVDTDALWANVYPHVKEEKGNRRVIVFFLLGLLLGLTAFSLFNFNQGNTISSNQPIESTNPITSTPVESTANTTQTGLDSQTTALSIGAITNTASNTTEVTENDFTKVKTTTNASDIKNTTATTTSTAVRTVARSTASSTSVQTNISKQDQIMIKKDIDTKTFIENNQAAPSLNQNEVVSQKKTTPNLSTNKSLTNSLLIDALNENISNQDDAFSIPESQQKNALDTYVNNLNRLKKATKKLRVGLGLYGGVSKSTNELSSNGDIGIPEYTAGRNASEKQLETVHLGFEVSVYTKNHLYLRSGAEYTRIASLYSSNSSLTSTDSVWDVTEIIINTATGKIDSIEGYVQTTTITEFTKKHYNYINLIDIPVIVGYQFEYEPWSVGIEGGIYANISTKYTGEISNTASDAFYDLEVDENKWFKTNIGIQPYIGLNAAYNLSDNFQVHFSPGFRFETLFSTKENPVKEKHASLGIRAGVRYIFD